MFFHKWVRWGLFMVLMTVSPKVAAAPFLIIHLDGIPSYLLFQELESGRLPGIAAAFSDGSRIEHALSLFPGGTEMIYPRLKRGQDSTTGLPIAWASYDREQEKEVGRVQNFLTLASCFPRQARYQLVEGFGRADFLAGLAMQNLPRFLENHPVVEFFWFPTDGAGHMDGKEAMLASLYRFDANLAKLLPRLKLDELNLLLYCDHGMAFSRQEVDFSATLSNLESKKVKYYMYPNIYLYDQESRAEIAALLVQHSKVDFAFYREDPTTVCGVSEAATMRFIEEDACIKYQWWGEADPLGYDSIACVDRFLSDEQWLELTAEAEMPAVPVQIFRYLSNPNTGDVVVVMNPPWRDITPSCREGGHLGVTAEDLLVGVLHKGTAFTNLKGRKSIWLHSLYKEVPELDFSQSPGRERHLVSLTAGSQPSVGATLSPGYRWLVSANSNTGLALDYDLITTYLGRIWGGFDGSLRITTEVYCGRWTISWRHWLESEKSEGTLSCVIHKGLVAKWTPGKGVGLAIEW